MTSPKEDQQPIVYICLTEGDDYGPRIRAWTTDPARAEQLRANGLNMVEYRKTAPMTTREELVGHTPGPWVVGNSGRMVLRDVPGMCDGHDGYAVVVTSSPVLSGDNAGSARRLFCRRPDG
jgi:hypothetical protein